jgi:hypothetical protein
MRTFVLFALTLAGAALVTDNASAGPFGRRGGAVASSSGGACCGGAMSYGTYGGYPGVAYSGVTGAYGSVQPGVVGPTGASGRATVIQTTDGQFYTLGADGSYYPSSGAAMAGYGQPMYRSYPRMTGYPYPGVYPAGYPGTYGYPGVYPAGGPIVMPGTNPGGVIPGGGVPNPMPPRK